jgi:hypothetical protein
VVELGARSADGQEHLSLKPLFADHTGIDIQKGVGVDIVADIAHPFVALPEVRNADIVLCLETLEHVPKFWHVLDLFKTMRAGTMLVFSAPYFSFPYHSHPIDCYRFSMDALPVIFEGFTVIQAEYLDDGFGNKCLYAVGVRNGD